MTWEEVKDLGPLYAVGALDAQTARAVEDFLRSATPEQKGEFVEWIEVASILPLALPQTEVPSHLKERLMARVNGSPMSVPSPQEETPARVLPFQPKQRSSQTTTWLLMAATLALAFSTAYLAWRNSNITEQLSELQQQMQVFLSPDTRIIAMAGVETPQASAKVVWDTKAQTWKVSVQNLPAPPDGKDYQLWYVTKDSAKINAKVFSPDAQGKAQFDLSLPPEAINGLAATAVTLEPKGGSPQPTGKFYLLAQI